jgi:pilus assembly protein CpaF
VTEVAGLEGDVVTLQDLFVARSPGEDEAMSYRQTLLGPLRSTGLLPGFLPKLATSGVDLPANLFDEAFE